MRRRLAALLAVAAGFAGITHVASAATADPQTSSNWAGYVASGTTFSSVSATWIAPRPSCAPGQLAYSSFWVGLGGSSSQSGGLEQIGTEADCKGTPGGVTSAWYELIPAPPVTIPLTIAAGDTVSASVSVDGTTVSFQLTDVTSGQSFTNQLTVASPDLSSAEWIAEAPSSCIRSGCSPLPLANFGTVGFSAAAATGAGHTGPISDPAWTTTPVQLLATSGFSRFGGFRRSVALTGGAAPGALSPDGSAFSVSWQQPQVAVTPPRRRPLPRWWWSTAPR